MRAVLMFREKINDMEAPFRDSNDRSIRWQWLVGVATAFYVIAGLAAMALRTPRSPYADQWRFYSNLLSGDFPWNVLQPDNGHYEILANAIRLADIAWSNGDQNILIGVSKVLASASFALLASTMLRRASTPLHGWAASLALALGVFWLGNERALTHSSDSIHAYSVTFFAFAAIALASVDCSLKERSRMLIASGAALVATFSFGSGIAAFPAMLLVLVLRRAPRGSYAIVISFLALALLSYAFAKADATTATLRIDPIAQAKIFLHWLSAPLIYVFWPLLDVDIAARLPQSTLARLAGWFAQAWTSIFGDIRTSRAPQISVGMVGIVLFARLAWRVFTGDRNRTKAQRVCLGVASFGMVIGAVVALSRVEYFAEFPGQIQALRYVPWSSLFWAGVLATLLLQMTLARKAACVALIAAVTMAPSQLWLDQVAASMRLHAEQTSLGALVGVLDTA
jgi:hypothetical protein